MVISRINLKCRFRAEHVTLDKGSCLPRMSETLHLFLNTFFFVCFCFLEVGFSLNNSLQNK